MLIFSVRIFFTHFSVFRCKKIIKFKHSRSLRLSGLTQSKIAILNKMVEIFNLDVSDPVSDKVLAIESKLCTTEKEVAHHYG